MNFICYLFYFCIDDTKEIKTDTEVNPAGRPTGTTISTNEKNLTLHIMSANPHQRKEYSLEKLNALRDEVRQAYTISKSGEILQTPKNKNSAYYSSLKDDILEKTKERISEGTLLKFFLNNINRNYQLIIINTIEKYVKQMLSDSTINKDLSNRDKKFEEEIKIFAHRIYIELTTRKAAIPIDGNSDVIEEIYNSWYKLFCIIRDEMKSLPIYFFMKHKTPIPIIETTNKILNEILRPHLTEHQAKYRSWLEKAKQNPKNKNITPQVLQKKYPDYDNLTKSMRQVNGILIDCAEKLINIINS